MCQRQDTSCLDPQMTFRGTLTVCVLLACFVLSRCYCKCQHLKKGRRGQKKAEAGMYGAGHFQHATGSNYVKPVLPLTRIKKESESRAREYRWWGQLCSCIGSYRCTQILLSLVHIWWMNHLAIGQAGSHCLCNKQKGFLHAVTTSVLQQREKHSLPFINSLEQEIISKCLSQILISSHHAISLETI